MPLLQDVELALRLRLCRHPTALVSALQPVQALVSLVRRLGLECFDAAALRGAWFWITGVRARVARHVQLTLALLERSRRVG